MWYIDELYKFAKYAKISCEIISTGKQVGLLAMWPFSLTQWHILRVSCLHSISMGMSAIHLQEYQILFWAKKSALPSILLHSILIHTISGISRKYRNMLCTAQLDGPLWRPLEKSSIHIFSWLISPSWSQTSTQQGLGKPTCQALTLINPFLQRHCYIILTLQ